MDWRWLACVFAAYLCGSIPFGLLIGLARGVDVRKAGSGNIGTTNVGRVLGRKWGILCFVLDMLKGLLPVLAVGLAWGYFREKSLPPEDAWRWLAIGAAAMMGHVYPVWLRFRGGKGVATGLGAVLGFWPVLTIPGLAAFLTWVALAALTRYVSVASIGGAVMLPIYLFILSCMTGRPPADVAPFLIVTGLMALLVVFRHRGNLRRLAAGTENKIGQHRAS